MADLCQGSYVRSFLEAIIFLLPWLRYILAVISVFVTVPPYEGKHKVFTAPWSYPEDLVSMVIDDAGNQGNSIPDNERIIDLTRGPPAYEDSKEYISRLKQDLGIKVNLIISEYKAK